jgi:16S rRNA (adenine1518-N6/adenine1519-N6)-dimethyltransferase
MKAKKSLGQHFLRSEKALSQIVAAGEITPTDTVLEIGPGEGALTDRLLKETGRVIAVEKDAELVAYLEDHFLDEISQSKLEIREADILSFDPQQLGPYKIVANIPYYITGAIIEKFLSAKHQPTRIVLLVQKEVAERISAKDKKQSIYSIAVAAYGKPRIVAKVPAGAFAPAPKVDSAILLISDISRDFFVDCDEELFFKVLKAVFGQKRKQIGGSLADFLENREKSLITLEKAGISVSARPETLSLSDWKRLTQHLGEK